MPTRTEQWAVAVALALVAETLMGAGITPGGAGEAGAQTPVYEFCATVEAARAYVIGVVWGDGTVAGGVVHARLSSQRASAAEAAANCAGIAVTRRRRVVELPGLTPDDVNLSGLPPSLVMDNSPGSAATKAFLAGVIEGEGSRTSGLVLDDPLPERVQAVPPLLDRVGMRWRTTTSKVFVDPADWPLFAEFPFAFHNRVPGYGTTWS